MTTFHFPASGLSRALPLLMAVTVLTGLAACAEERLRARSVEAMDAGRPAEAIQVLEKGVQEHPESPVLRAALIRTRQQAQVQAISEVATLRGAGRLDEADARLARALEVDPGDERLAELRHQLLVERRQRDARIAAEADLGAGRRDEAARRVAEALRDNPNDEALQALQRRIDTESRAAQLRHANALLDEARPVSLDFRDADLRNVLDAVSRTSGINFVFDRDLHADARVTVFLRQARVEDALDLITSTNHLSMKVMDPRTILIYPSTPEKQREYQEQVVRIFYLSNADAKGGAAFLRAMLKGHDPFVDERSNMIAVRDTPENVALAERLVAMYDSPEPEVLLEMAVLEISSTRLTELGVQLPTSISLTPVAPGGSTGGGLTLGNVTSLTRDNIALGLGGATINLRREVGDFSTLASPQIRVKNKEKARVMVGDKIPVVTTTVGTGGFVSDSVNYLDVGLKLEAEPTVFANDEVAIRVGLEVSTLGSAIKTASGTLAYQIGTRNANTDLRLRDGETQLLAGLISKDESSTSNRLPGLGDLPVIGRLFSSQLDNGQRKELVLAITPHVLRNMRQPTAAQAEIWVGTDAAPKLRPAGGLRADRGAEEHPSAAAPTSAGTAAGPSPAAAPAGAPAVPAAAAGPVLDWSVVAPAKVGDMIDVGVELASGARLRGLPLELRFDATRLQWVGATEGRFFRQDDAPTSFSISGPDASGNVRIGVLRNQATGLAGKERLVTLRFKAKAAGPASIAVQSAQALGIDGPTPPVRLAEPLKVDVQ